ncbi:991_t:CDS:2, partial [Paraglomus occultum]
NIRSYSASQQETLPADTDLATGKNDRVGNGMGAQGTFVNVIPVTSSETLHATSSVKSCHGNLNKKHPKRRRSSASYTLYLPASRPLFPNYADGRSRSKHNKKKYKLLILWPLPIITRYIILLSILISMLNWTGFISLKCSAPSFVIHRLEIENLLLSPFLFSLQMSNVLLAASNLLTLGLFEESLTSMLGGTKKFLGTTTSLMLGVCVLRQAIGFIFSRSTGWSIPSLFFSDSLHECNQGIAPFLFSLLVLQSLSIDDKYILYYGDKRHTKITLRKITLQLFMCMLNYTQKNILWWSVTGLLTGLIGTIAIHTTQTRETPNYDNAFDRLLPMYKISNYGKSTGGVLKRTWSGFKKSSIILLVTFAILLFCNFCYTRPHFVQPAALNEIEIGKKDRYLLSFLVMTAPRPGDPDYLIRTIDSYLNNFESDPSMDSFYTRTQMIIYTHFSNHTVFDQAKKKYSTDLKAQRYLKWVQEDGYELNQRLHVSKAMKLVAENFKTTYVALVEDDFPLCEDKWAELLTVVYEANVKSPDHCGVFVGTGGSGLIMKRKQALISSDLLLQEILTPPDIILQNCLLGTGKGCEECSQTLVTSKTLLMYHLGYNTSTSPDRIYQKNEFQCGWRHPFNGDPR